MRPWFSDGLTASPQPEDDTSRRIKRYNPSTFYHTTDHVRPPYQPRTRLPACFRAVAREQPAARSIQPQLRPRGPVGAQRAQAAERVARRAGAVCADERVVVRQRRTENVAPRRMAGRLAATAGQGFVQRALCERTGAQADRARRPAAGTVRRFAGRVANIVPPAQPCRCVAPV